MKYYKIERKTTLNDQVISGLNGIHVKDRELFFSKGKSGPDKFYDNDYEFDYLIPSAFGDGFGIDDEKPTLADWQTWWGSHTPGVESMSIPISKRFKECLEKFNLSSCRFYKAKVLHKKKLHPYFVWQMLMGTYEKFIDFEKSTFNNYNFRRDKTKTPFEVKQFKSIKELEEYADQYWGYLWNYEKLVVKPSFKEFDYHFMMFFNHVISERLKNEMEKQQLTGVEFKEQPIPLYFSDES